MKNGETGRRRFLKHGAGLMLAGSLPLAWSARTRAAKVPKTAMAYREHPHDGDSCTKCIYFQPGPGPSAPGTCSVVAGSISPRGYCIAFAPNV